MDELVATLLAWKSAAVAAWFIALFAAERVAPAAPAPALLDLVRLGRNGALWLANTALSLAVIIPLSQWADGLALWQRPVWWSGWWALLLDLVLLDGLIYWWHRANHEWPPLWRFHQVHHRDRFLDSTSAVRFHFGEVLLSALARAAVIVLLDVPLVAVLVFETLLLLATIFHHSNARLPASLERRLALLVVTPSIHWVHHHARQRDTEANYSTVLSLWDRLFGSRSPTARTPRMRIGIEGEEDVTLPALLLLPFRAPAAR